MVLGIFRCGYTHEGRIHSLTHGLSTATDPIGMPGDTSSGLYLDIESGTLHYGTDDSGIDTS